MGGGARANQFRVELNFPGFVSGGTQAARKGQFLCTAASLPGSHLGIAMTHYRGREVKLSGERTFTNWGVTVLNDNDFALHQAFVGWSSAINDPVQNTGLTNPLSYTADLNVVQMDRNGNDIQTYKIADAWPVNVSDIQLSFSANDQIEEFQVELAYSFWISTNSASNITANIGISTPVGGLSVSA